MPAWARVLLVLLAAQAGAPAARAQGSDAAMVQELRRQLDEMRRRVEQLEARAARGAPPRPTRSPAPPGVQADREAAQAAAREARAAADEAQAVQRDLARAPLPAAPAAAATGAISEATVAGLAPAAVVGNPFEDALRSDLPGIAFRVPGTDTQVRFYGFAKISTWYDLDGRNQTDAPLAGGIPLRGSPADRQGGEYGITARFSRLGIDSRSLTGWGTLETRIEGDFGGGTNNNALFRLRQAWAELGDERLRVLIGQTNSLWNEGLFETLIDATNLNQSFIRQAQLRLSGRLAQSGSGSLTGQLSAEMPETQYTAADGVVTPDSRILGLPSPAFNVMPDMHGRLTWRQDGLELVGRGMLRQLQLRPPGTALEGVAGTRNATGFGVAGHARLPMRWLAQAFGSDELLGMAYYGQGIGRYFASSTNGTDAVTNIDTLSGRAQNAAFDAVESWGVTAAYRRFWTPQLRSNLSYSYARQNFPGYVLDYQPGSSAALSLNSTVQQAFANVIWSPFGAVRNGVFGPGWLDVGLEYVFTRRDIAGGSPAAGSGRPGHGIANRILFATVARF